MNQDVDVDIIMFLGRKIPVAFTTGQCEEGSYLRNWIEVAGK